MTYQFLSSSLLPTGFEHLDQKGQDFFLSKLRDTLRFQLWTDRGILVVKSFGLTSLPKCPICDQPIESGFDLHEAIITRGDVRGVSFDEFLKIFVPENCVLIHTGKCHDQAQWAESGKLLCAKHLIQWQGKKAVLAWLQALNCVARDEAIRYVEAV